MRLIEHLLELLFPRRCVLCGRLLEKDETDLCRDCRETTEEFPFCEENMHPSGKSRLQFLDSFTAVWYYKENVRRGLLRYKFYRARFLRRSFGRFLGMKLLREGRGEYDLITWAPVSFRRRLTRGYDQSELLARCLGEELGIDTVRLLRKRRNNPAQSGLSQELRKGNVLGVYAFCGKIPITGKRILLVDDIFTTGATAEECARILLTAGAKEVHCAVMASASHPKK